LLWFLEGFKVFFLFFGDWLFLLFDFHGFPVKVVSDLQSFWIPWEVDNSCVILFNFVILFLCVIMTELDRIPLRLLFLAGTMIKTGCYWIPINKLLTGRVVKWVSLGLDYLLWNFIHLGPEWYLVDAFLSVVLLFCLDGFVVLIKVLIAVSLMGEF